MARKQTSRRLNRFLDLIGLVDSERDEDMEQEPVRSAKNRSARRGNDDEFDEFADFEEQTSARQRRNLSQTRRNSRVNVENEGDEFDEDQGWTTASSGYIPRSARARTSGTSASNRTTARSGYRAAGSSAASPVYERRSMGASSGYRAAESTSRYRGSAAHSYAASRRDEAGYNAPPAAPSAYQRHQTIIFMLHSVDECKEVILSLIDKKSVLLNLDELDAVQAQRALDTMSGATYAIGATLSRASDRTWLITPSNVEVERSSMDADGYN